MLVIGLTGGIGSGKSQASAIFDELGADIIDADVIAREVVEPPNQSLHSIAEHFGANILHEDGHLNRTRLREIVFKDGSQRQWLEQLLHPLIRNTIIERINASTKPYCLLVSPLLLETNQHELCDRIIVIDATEEHQIERAMNRDHSSEQQIKAIISTQLKASDRIAKADDVVDNNSTTDHLKSQVESLHRRYMKLI